MVDVLTAARSCLPQDDDDEQASVDIYQGGAYREAIKELHSLDKLETPYGQLMEKFVFVEDEAEAEGEFPTIEYINPFALLSHLAAISKEFFG